MTQPRKSKPLSRRPKTPRGDCPDCQGSYALKADGTLRGHGWKDQGHKTQWCPGSWKKPRQKGNT